MHLRSVPVYDSDVISPIVCRSKGEVSRPRHDRGPLALDLRPPVASVDDRGQRSVSLSHTKDFLLHNVDCFGYRL